MGNDEQTTNRAKRLSDVIVAASKIPSKSENRQHTVRQAWCMVFGMDDPSTDTALIEVLGNLTIIREEFDELIEMLEAIEGLNHELYVAPIKSLRGIVSNLNIIDASWGNYVHYFSKENLTSLRFVVDFVSNRNEFNEKVVPPDELAGILADANALYDQVLNSKLSRPTKRVFLEIIEQLRSAVHEYRLRGPKGLKNALARATTILISNQEVVAENKDAEELVAIALLMKRVDNIYQLATTAIGLYEATTKLLPVLGG